MIGGAYVRTDEFGGSESDLGLPGQGISLATAMTISGAAVSPSRGYNTSPATAFLMAMFNLRLGAWLPNPAHCELINVLRSGPRYALAPLLWELLGLTNADGKDIYLTDGGHFENLGLYEMVRRRCRFIVVSDAGCDPDCTFEDLGNAVRKIFIDQRIRIEFANGIGIIGRKLKQPTTISHAIGRIHYPELSEPGWLLYIKPSYLDTAPVDVRAYGTANDTFPHETTTDQWFGELQFESYRRLGEFIVT